LRGKILTGEVAHDNAEQLIGDELVARSLTNPFPTRQITTPFATFEDLYLNLMKMLSMYGHHVWHLTCDLRYDELKDPFGEQDVDSAFRNLVWILGRTPNLKVLDITSEYDGDELENWENRNLLSLPPLNQLVSLCLRLGLHEVLPPFCLELIKAYGAQLTTWITKTSELD